MELIRTPRVAIPSRRRRTSVSCCNASGSAEGWSQKLKRAGRAGVLAYGTLTTLYYAAAFGIAANASNQVRSNTLKASFVNATKLMAVVWAGSQATKPLRAFIAVGLTPACSAWLRLVERVTGVKDEAKAFSIIIAVIAILGLSVMAVCALAFC